jgi:ligand-binding sensor domain-containing protein
MGRHAIEDGRDCPEPRRRHGGHGVWRAVVTVKNGMASNVILSLAAAPNGDLWVGTPDGLNRIRMAASVDVFTSADGLPDDFMCVRC